MPLSRVPRTTFAFRGNNRAKCVQAVNGLLGIIDYHNSLTVGSGLPRVWPTTLDTAASEIFGACTGALTQKYPPAINPA
jgi:hypothetical protein